MLGFGNGTGGLMGIGSRHIGAMVAAFGFLLLALNLVDYAAGRYRMADISTLVGGICVVGGAYFALRGK